MQINLCPNQLQKAVTTKETILGSSKTNLLQLFLPSSFSFLNKKNEMGPKIILIIPGYTFFRFIYMFLLVLCVYFIDYCYFIL